MNIKRELLLGTVKKMHEEGYDYLVKITAVDYVKTLEVVYILRNLNLNKDELLEVTITPEDAWINSIIEIYKAAEWYERELQEMFGIKIKDKKLKKLLLEKWDGKGYPLRKNFLWNKPYEKV